MHPRLVLAAVLAQCTLVHLLICASEAAKNASSSNAIRIFALFGGTKNDLGIDHRLGRQVLRLASNRAKQLDRGLAGLLEIVVLNEDSDCGQSVGVIPKKLAEHFYSDQEFQIGDGKCEGEIRKNSANTEVNALTIFENAKEQPKNVSEEDRAELLPRKGDASWANFKENRPKSVDAILGSGCDSLIDTVARMAAYWQVPLFSTTSIGGQFARKDIYTTLTRLSPSVDHLSMFFVRLLEEFKWHRLAVLLDESEVENKILNANLELTIERMKYDYQIERVHFRLNGSDSLEVEKGPQKGDLLREKDAQSLAGNGTVETQRSHCSPETRRIILEIQRVARVVLLLVNDATTMRRLLLCAHELQMNNGEYAFLAIKLGLKSGTFVGHREGSSRGRRQSAGGTKAANLLDWFRPDEEADNSKVRQMFESLMILSVELPIGAEYEYFVEQTLELSRQAYPHLALESSSIGPLAVALHDGLLLAVESVRRARIGPSSGQSLKANGRPVLGQSELWSGSNRRHTLSSVGAAGSSGPDGGDSGECATFLEEYDDTEGEDYGKFVENIKPNNETYRLGKGPRGGNKKVNKGTLLWDERGAGALTAGLLTRDLHINANGDQELDYILSDMEPELGLMRPVASYSRSSQRVEFLANTYVHWPARLNGQTGRYENNEEAPPDEPECGFEGNSGRCLSWQNLYLLLLIVLVFGLILSLVVAFTLVRYRRIKYQMQLDDYWWKIGWAELQFVRVSDASMLGSARSQLSGGRGPILQPNTCSVSPHVAAQLSVSGGKRQTAPGSLVGSLASASSRLTQRSASLVGRQPASGGEPAAKQQEPRAPKQRRSALVPAILAPHLAPESCEQAGADEDEERATVASSARSLSRLTAPASCGQPASASLMAVDCGSCFVRSEYSTMVLHSTLALYRGELVILKKLNKHSLNVTRALLVDLKAIRELVHENLAKFVGICLEPGHLYVGYEYCSRGSLQDLLANESVAMDWNLRYSIIGDILNGLHFIHTSLFEYHGRLKSTNLVLDSRFTVKLTDFGLRNLYNQVDLINDRELDELEELDEDKDSSEPAANRPAGSEARELAKTAELGGELRRMSNLTQTIYNMDSVSIRAERMASGAQWDETAAQWATSGGRSGGPKRNLNLAKLRNEGSRRFFWTAPEHLRQPRPHLAGSKRGDIYALGVLLFELFTRRQPYHYGTTARPHWAQIRRERAWRQTEVGVAQRCPQTQEWAAGRAGRRARGPRRTRPAQVAPEDAGSGSQASGHSGGSSGEFRPPTGRLSQAISINVSPASPIQEAANEQGEPFADHAEPADTPDTVCGQRRAPLSSAGPTEPGGVSASDCGQRARNRHEQPSSPAEVLDQLRMGLQPEPVRPYVPKQLMREVSPQLVELMQWCWSEAPGERPTVGQLRASFKRLTNGATAKNYLDNLLERLQSYAGQLEHMVDTKSAAIMAEKRRTEELLYQLLPRCVADKLKHGQPIVPQLFDGVTIFFSDIVGFEKYAAFMSPRDQVDLLNNIYSSFDSIISSFDVTKIEVILDQFLVAGGLKLEPETGASWHEAELAHELPTADPKVSASGERKPLSETSRDEQERAKKSIFRRAAFRFSGSKSSEETSSRRPNRKQQSLDEPQREAQTESSEYFRRASAEQVARMALCIRDLVKSFHFRQNLGQSLAGSGQSEQQQQIARQESGESRPEVEQEDAGKPEGGQKECNLIESTFNIRIGIHSGKVCAGIVGLRRPKFCLIGDTVNVASRMHTNSKANRIQVSPTTRELLKQVPGFKLEPRGRIEVKGKGAMETFWLESSY